MTIGRPKRDGGQKIRVAFRCDSSDCAKAKEKAKKLGMSLSSYINLSLLERLVRDDNKES